MRYKKSFYLIFMLQIDQFVQEVFISGYFSCITVFAVKRKIHSIF